MSRARLLPIAVVAALAPLACINFDDLLLSDAGPQDGAADAGGQDGGGEAPGCGGDAGTLVIVDVDPPALDGAWQCAAGCNPESANAGIHFLAVSGTDRLFASADDAVLAYDVDIDGELSTTPERIECGDLHAIESISLRGDGAMLIGAEDALCLIDAGGGRHIARFVPEGVSRRVSVAAAFVGDGSQIVAAGGFAVVPERLSFQIVELDAVALAAATEDQDALGGFARFVSEPKLVVETGHASVVELANACGWGALVVTGDGSAFEVARAESSDQPTVVDIDAFGVLGIGDVGLARRGDRILAALGSYEVGITLYEASATMPVVFRELPSPAGLISDDEEPLGVAISSSGLAAFAGNRGLLGAGPLDATVTAPGGPRLTLALDLLAQSGGGLWWIGFDGVIAWFAATALPAATGGRPTATGQIGTTYAIPAAVDDGDALVIATADVIARVSFDGDADLTVQTFSPPFDLAPLAGLAVGNGALLVVGRDGTLRRGEAIGMPGLQEGVIEESAIGAAGDALVAAVEDEGDEESLALWIVGPLEAESPPVNFHVQRCSDDGVAAVCDATTIDTGLAVVPAGLHTFRIDGDRLVVVARTGIVVGTLAADGLSATFLEPVIADDTLTDASLVDAIVADNGCVVVASSGARTLRTTRTDGVGGVESLHSGLLQASAHRVIGPLADGLSYAASAAAVYAFELPAGDGACAVIDTLDEDPVLVGPERSISDMRAVAFVGDPIVGDRLFVADDNGRIWRVPVD